MLKSTPASLSSTRLRLLDLLYFSSLLLLYNYLYHFIPVIAAVSKYHQRLLLPPPRSEHRLILPTIPFWRSGTNRHNRASPLSSLANRRPSCTSSWDLYLLCPTALHPVTALFSFELVTHSLPHQKQEKGFRQSLYPRQQTFYHCSQLCLGLYFYITRIHITFFFPLPLPSQINTRGQLGPKGKKKERQ